MKKTLLRWPVVRQLRERDPLGLAAAVQSDRTRSLKPASKNYAQSPFRGGATTHQMDLQNADVITIMGSNMAENHPVGFQWVMEAREGDARAIPARVPLRARLPARARSSSRRSGTRSSYS